MNFISWTKINSVMKFKFKLFIKKIIPFIFSFFGFNVSINSTNELIISRNLEETLSKIKIANTVQGIEEIENESFKKFIFSNIQYLDEGLQVLWILFLFDCKKNGYFVEFGACDGLHFSNTNLLEKEFGWEGILVEPSRGYSNAISKNRNVVIDKRLVWSKTGESIEFGEVSAGGLSGVISSFRGTHSLMKRQLLGIKKYKVETVSLNDLLDEHKSPLNFDFLSIDTEGSEFEIVKNFNLNKYRPKVISIEHGGDFHMSEKCEEIFFKYGYKLVSSELNDQSNMWFIQNEIQTS
jgi:FkbM family methyltransferase